MAWAEHHKLSEGLASVAQLASLQGRQAEALELYARAADAEVKALDDLDLSKVRTAGISAVSAASLYYKAADLRRSEAVAAQWLGVNALPSFAKKQLRGLLRSIWSQADNASRPHSEARTNAKIAPTPDNRHDLEDALWVGVAVVEVVRQTMQSMKGGLTPSAQRACIGSNFERNLERAETAIAEVRQMYEVARNAHPRE